MNIKKRLITMQAVVFILTLVAISYAGPAPAPTSTPQTIVLSAVTNLRQNDNSNAPLRRVIDKLTERSKGQLAIRWLGGPEAMAIPDQVMAAKNGVVDMVYGFAGSQAGLVQGVQVVALSRLTAAQERRSGFTALLSERYDKVGLVYLGRGALIDGSKDGLFYIWLMKQIETPKQLAKMKIGGNSPQSQALLSALGATLNVIPYADVYVALQTGVVDGFWVPFSDVAINKLFEVTRYFIDHAHFNAVMTFYINKNSYKRLPGNLQKVLQDVIIEQENDMPALHAPVIARDKQISLDKGVRPIKFSPAEAEWYLNTIYEAEWQKLTKQFPDLMPRFREALRQ